MGSNGGDAGDQRPGRPITRSARQPAGDVGDGGPPTRATPVVDSIGDQPTGPVPVVTAPRRRRAGRATARPADPVGVVPAATPRRGDPGRLPRRYRVLPRTLLGITALILAFAIGSGFSGVVLYSYYQYHIDQTDSRVNTLISGYKKQFANAQGDLQAIANTERSQLQAQLAPIQQLEGDPQTLAKLVKDLAPSLFFVHTLDQSGQPSVGTAFVISSSGGQSLLITSYTAVAAATRSPGPQVYVRQNNVDTAVTVRSYDPQYDLALIVLPHGGLPAVTPAPSTPATQVGERLYALSGLGAGGASISEGAATDVSASGVENNTPLNASFQGGPLVNANGQVVAVASQTYAPLGYPGSAVGYAPYLQAACNRVLSCPGGKLPTGG